MTQFDEIRARWESVIEGQYLGAGEEAIAAAYERDIAALLAEVERQASENARLRSQRGRENLEQFDVGEYHEAVRARDAYLHAVESQAAKIGDLLAEVERLRKGIDRIMIGGNHLATFLGNQLSPAEYNLPYLASFDEAFKVFGDGNIRYEAWVCWRELMQVRDDLGL